jgi:GntR family transcriptional regulator
MYQQIADDLRRQIESGALQRGGRLPTELELRKKYDASRNTVRDALGRLTQLGLVETRPGKGTFVTKAVEPFLTDLSPQDDRGEERQALPIAVMGQPTRVRMGQLTVTPLGSPPEVADRLGVGLGSEVISRSQELYIDDALWLVQTSYYPRKWYDDGARRLLESAEIPEGAIRYLDTAVGLKQVRYEDCVTVRPAKENESLRFGLPHTAFMFLIYRTGFTGDGTAIRVTASLCPADRNQFTHRYG